MFRLVLVFISTIATTSYGRNVNTFPRSLGERIVEGEITTIEKYPYQVSLQSKGKPWCGGSLIRPDVVLTAAHCMENWPPKYSVRAGSNTTTEGGQVAQVTDICSHFKYKHHSADYDVSVLKLNKPFNLNSAVQLINLQNVDEEVQANTIATVTGWGLTKLDETERSKWLRKVDVPKVDHEKCQKLIAHVNINVRVTDRMTCYGYIRGEKGACEGDSGGPLVVNGKQVGIVSWGDCALPYSLGVYTRLENEEIDDHINDCLAKFN